MVASVSEFHVRGKLELACGRAELASKLGGKYLVIKHREFVSHFWRMLETSEDGVREEHNAEMVWWNGGVDLPRVGKNWVTILNRAVCLTNASMTSAETLGDEVVICLASQGGDGLRRHEIFPSRCGDTDAQCPTISRSGMKLAAALDPVELKPVVGNAKGDYAPAVTNQFHPVESG